MSTLPFLLSVADELDNINSQSYMDDFGLGFHPHRQYYRTPTIQLSLPASTDWTGGGRQDWQGQQQGRRGYRSYKFYDDTQNNLEEEEDHEKQQCEELQVQHHHNHHHHHQHQHQQQQQHQQQHQLLQQEITQQQQHQHQHQHQQQQQQHLQSQPPTSGRQGMVQSTSHDIGVGGLGLNLQSGGDEEDDENIDRTVRMYNLSKKCCKNYYRHALETGPAAGSKVAKCSQLRSENSHKSSSSSEESLQKIPSPIEFLTCFLIKKSSSSSGSNRASKCLGQQQQLQKKT